MKYDYFISSSICGSYENIRFYYADSVQTSLEKKFGQYGGKIPIVPTDSFERKIAVSVRYYILLHSHE